MTQAGEQRVQHERPLRIAYITAGAAGMYCGTCLQDNTLASRLIQMGQDVALIPTYTPIRTDEDDVSVDRVFYGAINVYLEQKSALFRHTPWLVDRLLNGKRLLRWASRHGTSVDARDLGDLTLSVLQGEEGNQRKELAKLVGWLRDELKPDVVHLSNSMLLGMAGPIRRELGVPVLCSLQGEDIFLDDLREPFKTSVRDTLREKAADAAAFATASRYYADYMAQFLAIPRERVHLVPLGIKLDGFEEPAPRDDTAFVIGYLARICPEKGLHLLVQAFRDLIQTAGRERVRLAVAGYVGERDRPYLEGILEQLKSWGLSDRVDYVGEVDRQGKIEFLQSLHVLSVPTVYRDPKGLFVIESLAAGTPVVLPDHGAFPEWVEATGGGLLVEPGDAPALAQALQTMLEDPARRAELGRRGHDVVHREYNDAASAEKLLGIYRMLTA